MNSWSAATKWTIIVAICAAAFIGLALHPPIPQPQSYHQFADTRALLGIPRALDVLSNLSFLAVGIFGLCFNLHRTPAFPRQGVAYTVLFIGLILTAAGSCYYHLDPGNARLVWDRLPMTVAMTGCISALLIDRFGAKLLWTLPVSLAAGFATVLQWMLSEQAGHGDLRWYGLYQGLVIVVGAALLILFPSRTSGTREFTFAILANIAAKIFELLDRQIFSLGGIVSGHTLKHLAAGLGFAPLAFLMHRLAREIRKPHAGAIL